MSTSSPRSSERLNSRNFSNKLAARQSVHQIGHDEKKHLHTRGYHLRYATCQIAFWMAQFAFTQQDSLYMLGFKQEAGTTAAISAASVVASLFFMIIMGQLQDLEVLSRWYPVEKWGRRAPWYKTHLLVLGPALFLLLNPPATSRCQCRKPMGNNEFEWVDVGCDSVVRFELEANASITGTAACDNEKETCSREVGVAWRSDDNTSDINQGCQIGEFCTFDVDEDIWSCSTSKLGTNTSDDSTGGESATDKEEEPKPEEICPDGAPKYRFLDRTFLATFSIILLLICNWCGVGMRLSMNSALYEMFPFDRERIQVSAYLTLMFTLVFVCMGVAGAPTLIFGYPTQPDWKTMYFGGMLWALSLISLLSVETMKDADQSATSIELSPLENIRGVLKIKAFPSFMMAEVLHAVVGGNLTVLNIPFFMYVGKLTLKQALQLLLPWVLSGQFTELMMAPFWVSTFKKGSARLPKIAAQCGLSLTLITAPIIYAVPYFYPDGPIGFAGAFIIDFVVYCILKSPREYWRVTALGLTIDDDCHNLGGQRREATIISAITVFKSIALGVVSQAFVAGMDFVGNVDTSAPDIVTTPCYHEEILDQPSRGEISVYLLIVFAFINPVMNVLQAYQIERFPLHPESDAHTSVVERQKQSFKVPNTSYIAVRRFSSYDGKSMGMSSISGPRSKSSGSSSSSVAPIAE